MLLCLVMAFSLFCITASAEGRLNINDTECSVNDKIVYMGVVAPDCVPSGIVPLAVGSMEEAEKVISIYTSTFASTIDNPVADTTAVTSTYDVEITRTQYGGIFSSGLMVTELRVSYNIVNNRISGASPYTSTYGVPIFADYTETSCTGYIVANTEGKEYYAVSKGQIDYYIIVDGFINWYTSPVSLAGQKKLVN